MCVKLYSACVYACSDAQQEQTRLLNSVTANSRLIWGRFRVGLGHEAHIFEVVLSGIPLGLRSILRECYVFFLNQLVLLFFFKRGRISVHAHICGSAPCPALW